MISFYDLRQANTTRQIEWEAGIEFSLLYYGNALAGEVGEACNIIKKLEREASGHVGSRASKEALMEELADIIIYADLIAARLGKDLGEAVRKKFNATSMRYNLGVTL